MYITSMEHKAALVNAGTKRILKKAKVQSWAVRFYGCWAEDLCQIIDSIPDSYADKDSIPKEVWDVLRLDSISYSNENIQCRKYHSCVDSIRCIASIVNILINHMTT